MVHSLLIAAALMPAVVTTTTPNAKGLTLARQPLQATGKMRAESRTIYLNREGVTLRPGDNNSTANTSSVVSVPTYITPWDIDDGMWADTVACMRELYGPFDVVVTDVDPGDVPHIEAVFGGHPADVGLPDNVAGVSPFTTDCAVIERSVVFTFTDVMDDDARTMCEVMAQEIAHSYGLDHELLPEDPMTYLEYAGERTFQDEMATCGEFGGRVCGIGGSMCRERQNSHALLTERLGANPSLPPGSDDDDDGGKSGVSGGCMAAGEGGGGALGIGLVLLVGHLVARRRPRDRRHRALLQ